MRLARPSFLWLMGLAAGCGPEDSGYRAEPVRIGVITSLEGGLASVGGPLLQAARVAEREANAAGGVLGGRPIEMVVVDDRTQPETAGQLAQNLIFGDQVVAILGALSSDSSLQALSVSAPARIPQVSCCSTSPVLTTAEPPGDRYFFRTVPSDLLQGVVIARYAKNVSCASLAIMYSSTSYGMGLYEAIRTEYLRLEGTISAEVAFEPAQPVYSAEVGQLAEATLDCVALVGLPQEGGTILRDWNALTSPPVVRWIGTDGLKTSDLAMAAGDPAVVDGVVGTAPITAPMSMQFNEFAAAYEATWGEPTEIFAGNQYDAAALLILAIEAAGSTDGTAIRDALRRVAGPDAGEEFFGPGRISQALARLRAGADIDYFGASGAVDFSPTGDVVTDYEIWRFDAASMSFERFGIVRAAEIQ